MHPVSATNISVTLVSVVLVLLVWFPVWMSARSPVVSSFHLICAVSIHPEPSLLWSSVRLVHSQMTICCSTRVDCTVFCQSSSTIHYWRVLSASTLDLHIIVLFPGSRLVILIFMQIVLWTLWTVCSFDRAIFGLLLVGVGLGVPCNLLSCLAVTFTFLVIWVIRFRLTSYSIALHSLEIFKSIISYLS